jgi:2-keto-4-pentenoate hydratase
VHPTPIKIERGMQRQLALWRDTTSRPPQRLGWKIGFNMAADQQRLGLPAAMVGFLSNERRIAPGACYHSSPHATLLVEPEVAILIGSDLAAGASAATANAAIEAYSAALELVDTTRSVHDDIEAILAGNMFHEAVVLAEQRLLPDAFHRDQLSLSLRINQQEVRTLEQARVPQDFSTLIITVANTLAAHGEQLQAGDWIITGAAARPVSVKAADHIALEIGALGTVTLCID